MMKHEYKFRGWDAIGQKGWVYGDLVHNQKVTATGLEPRVMVGGYEVVPESVGLYTEKKDCDGREIYEGDILDATVSHYVLGGYVEEDYILEVMLIEGTFMAEYTKEGEERGWDLFWLCDNDEEVKVIGTVFEQNREK